MIFLKYHWDEKVSKNPYASEDQSCQVRTDTLDTWQTYLLSFKTRSETNDKDNGKYDCLFKMVYTINI